MTGATTRRQLREEPPPVPLDSVFLSPRELAFFSEVERLYWGPEIWAQAECGRALELEREASHLRARVLVRLPGLQAAGVFNYLFLYEHGMFVLGTVRVGLEQTDLTVLERSVVALLSYWERALRRRRIRSSERTAMTG